MVALQLLFFLVALLTLDGAKPKGKQLSKRKKPCENLEWYLFCQYVKSSYGYNDDAIYELEVQEVESERFTEDIRRLRDANRAINALLNLEAENKSELVEGSRTPLGKEVHALFQLRVTCSDGRRQLIVCNETLDYVYLGTYYLIKAIEEVAEGEQLKAIEEAHKNFRPKFLNPPKNETIFEAVTVFGSAVLSALKRVQQK